MAGEIFSIMFKVTHSEGNINIIIICIEVSRR